MTAGLTNAMTWPALFYIHVWNTTREASPERLRTWGEHLLQGSLLEQLFELQTEY